MPLVPLIMEEIDEVINAVPRERIAKRICEHIVDVDGSQVVEQDTEVPKTSSRDRNLTVYSGTDSQCSRAGNGETVGGSAEDYFPIQQQTLEQIVDTPVPHVVEELAEIFKVLSLDGVQQRSVEQTIETPPAISLAGKIVEMPVQTKKDATGYEPAGSTRRQRS